MSKKVLCIIMFCLSQHFLFAQQSAQTIYNSNLKAGLLYTSFGLGDLNGIAYYNEYNRQLSRFLTIAPSIQVGYGSGSKMVGGSDFINEVRFTKASVAADFNVFISPINFERFKVRIGAGPSLRYLSDSYPNSFSIYSLPNLPSGTTYVISPLTYSKAQNYLTIGYSAILDGEVNLSAHWNVGARASFQGYASKETVLAVGLNAGYRF